MQQWMFYFRSVNVADVPLNQDRNSSGKKGNTNQELISYEVLRSHDFGMLIGFICCVYWCLVPREIGEIIL